MDKPRALTREEWESSNDTLPMWVASSRDEAREFIASQDADLVSDRDVSDDETGEIHIEAGDSFGDSWLHPSYRARRLQRRRDNEEEDELDDVDDERDYEKEFSDALEEFSSFWEDFDGDEDEAQGAAQDAYVSFFADYPQWTEWASKLGMDRLDVISAVADRVYDSISKGKREKNESVIREARYRTEEEIASLLESEPRALTRDEFEEFVEELDRIGETCPIWYFPTKEDAKKFIMNQPSKFIVDRDISDDETGELWMEAGEEFGSSQFNPALRSFRKGEEPVVVYAGDTEYDDSSKEFHNALKKFSSVLETFKGSNNDAYREFFDLYPRWKLWSKVLGMVEISEDLHDLIDSVLKNKKESSMKFSKRTSFICEARSGRRAHARPPETFHEFRRELADKLRRAGAPEDFADEVEDVDYEGPGVPEKLYNAWEWVLKDLEEFRNEIESDGFGSVFEGEIRSAVINALQEYSSEIRAMTGKRPNVDDIALAEKVLELWT